jgi:YD repeat-containing protein
MGRPDVATHDARNQLLTKATQFGTLIYTYYAAGNTLTLKSSNAGGASMTYGYDPLNRLAFRHRRQRHDDLHL